MSDPLSSVIDGTMSEDQFCLNVRRTLLGLTPIGGMEGELQRNLFDANTWQPLDDSELSDSDLQLLHTAWAAASASVPIEPAVEPAIEVKPASPFTRARACVAARRPCLHCLTEKSGPCTAA